MPSSFIARKKILDGCGDTKQKCFFCLWPGGMSQSSIALGMFWAETPGKKGMVEDSCVPHDSQETVWGESSCGKIKSVIPTPRHHLQASPVTQPAIALKKQCPHSPVTSQWYRRQATEPSVCETLQGHIMPNSEHQSTGFYLFFASCILGPVSCRTAT